YPLCRPWRDPIPGAHQEAGTHLTTRFGTLNGGFEHNFAVLLPPNAQVTAIYGATAPAGKPLADCSVLKCPVPAHAQVEDSIYTRGRGVIFSFRNKDAKPGNSTKGGA